MKTTGGQTYNDAVTLGNDTILTDTGSSAITLAQTVNAIRLCANREYRRGTTTFGGAVGGTTAAPPASPPDLAGTTAINGGSVRTTGGQTYNDAVTLGADTILTDTGSSAITLAQTVNVPFALLTVRSPEEQPRSAERWGERQRLTSVTTDLAGTTAINGGVV